MTMVIYYFVFGGTQALNAATAFATGCGGANGHAYNYKNVYKAQQRALQECEKDCNICRIFHSNADKGWGALAVKGSKKKAKRIGVAAGMHTRHAAMQKALEECGHGCFIWRVWKDTVGTR